MTEAERTTPLTRVAIVGAGAVGASFANDLLLSGLVEEIVLIDVNRDKAEGEAMDLNHAIPYAAATRVWAGDYPDCRGAAVIVVAAGVAQRPGETRIDLLQRNIGVFQSVIPNIVRHNREGVLLIATNPVDILTYAAWRISRWPPSRVLGSGAVLDTARFRYLLGRHFDVDPTSVHAHIIGEHGDTELPVWSRATIGGMSLREYSQARGAPYDEAALQRIFRETRDAAYEIIRRKGATYYAIAAGLLRIVRAIVRDERSVLCVSSLVEGYCGLRDVCLSLPTVVGKQGRLAMLPLKLVPEEERLLRHSASALRSQIEQLQFD